MIIRKEIDLNEPLTEAQKQMLEAMQARPVQPDEECPELTDEQILQMAKAAREKRKLQTRQTVAIRLSPQAFNKAKSLGKGYTTILSRILEAALADNETIKRYL